MRIEPRRLAPRGDEDVLRQLLGRLAGAQESQPHRVDGAAEPRVERADRGVVTGQKPFHQLFLLPREEGSVAASLHGGSFR